MQAFLHLLVASCKKVNQLKLKEQVSIQERVEATDPKRKV